MKKLLALALALAMVLSVSLALADTVKVGVVNNPPSESGYRAANVADFESVFTAENGYEMSRITIRRLQVRSISSISEEMNVTLTWSSASFSTSF